MGPYLLRYPWVRIRRTSDDLSENIANACQRTTNGMLYSEAGCLNAIICRWSFNEEAS